MKGRISKSFRDKREGMVYVVVLLWIVFGLLAATYESDFEHVAVYYLSLTAFVSSFIWGESVRPSEETSVFFRGKNSRREAMVYIGILLWLALGVYGVITHTDLLSISAYFAALSPFCTAYIIGETYKPVAANTLRPQLADRYGYGSGGYEPSVDKGNANYKKEDDPHVQKILEDKKKDINLPDPDVQDEDTAT
jgi:hypothetical protein